MARRTKSSNRWLAAALAAQLAGLSLVAIAPSAGAADVTQCTCKGARNVKNRLCEVRAARREYDRIASNLMAQERKSGKPLMLDGTTKDQIRDCVQEAVNSVADGGAQDALGDTDPSCNVSVYAARDALPPSMCIAESVRRHEEFHRQECLTRENGKWQRVWSSDAPIKSALIDTKFAMSAVDYMAEEQAAYLMEDSDLDQTLRRLAQTCPAADMKMAVGADDEIAGKSKDEEYSFDMSMDGCPSRPRPSTSNCKL